MARAFLLTTTGVHGYTHRGERERRGREWWEGRGEGTVKRGEEKGLRGDGRKGRGETRKTERGRGLRGYRRKEEKAQWRGERTGEGGGEGRRKRERRGG